MAANIRHAGLSIGSRARSPRLLSFIFSFFSRQRVVGSFASARACVSTTRFLDYGYRREREREISSVWVSRPTGVSFSSARVVTNRLGEEVWRSDG